MRERTTIRGMIEIAKDSEEARVVIKFKKEEQEMMMDVMILEVEVVVGKDGLQGIRRLMIGIISQVHPKEMRKGDLINPNMKKRDLISQEMTIEDQINQEKKKGDPIEMTETVHQKTIAVWEEAAEEEVPLKISVR